MRLLMEIWKDISGFDGVYKISNQGNVFSYMSRKCIKPKENSNGYLRVQLAKGNGKKKVVFVHRLVAKHFVDNPNNYPVVNHLDFNPKNNNASNLEWTTRKGNIRYSIDRGRFDRTDEWLGKLRSYNEAHGRSVIGTNTETGETIRFVFLNDCKKAGFSPSCVCNCCQGKKNRHTHKGYEWRYGD